MKKKIRKIIFIYSLLLIVSSAFADLTLDKTNLLWVPMARQCTSYSCGVAVLRSIFGYYGEEDVREDNLVKILASGPKIGTDYKRIVEYSRSKGYKVEIYYAMTLQQLKKSIRAGKPVILPIQAWADTPINYKDDWNDGHYVIAIGFDKQKIYFMDPSTFGYYTYIPTTNFLKRWHDIDQRGIKLIHFAIVISKKKAVYNPSIIKLLK